MAHFNRSALIQEEWEKLWSTSLTTMVSSW